nr:ribonuclease H-like domain-containing protein [Tanacetum cinerariifolium]
VVQTIIWYLDSGYSKHMTEDRSQLTNFVNKFLDGLGHNLFSVGQFCDLDLEVAFRQHTYFIRNLDVPPPYSGNYMPPRADLSFAIFDNFFFKSKVSETITSVPKIEINASKTCKDTLKKPKTVRSSAPIIEDWESDSENENVFRPKEVKKIVKPSLEKIEFVNSRNITVENENKAEKPRKFSQSPRGIENQMDHKVKTIICDNGTEFKNRIINELCEMKGRTPALRFMRPFGCPDTILNTLDHLGKFDGKYNDGFFVGYSINSKAFRETANTNSTNKLNTVSSPVNASSSSFTIVDPAREREQMNEFESRTPALRFMRPFGCLDTILNTLDYLGNQTNGNAGSKENIDARQAGKKIILGS